MEIAKHHGYDYIMFIKGEPNSKVKRQIKPSVKIGVKIIFTPGAP